MSTALISTKTLTVRGFHSVKISHPGPSGMFIDIPISTATDIEEENGYNQDHRAGSDATALNGVKRSVIYELTFVSGMHDCDDGTTKLEVVAGEPDADTAWFVENLGNDRYRISHGFSGKSYQPEVHVQGASIHQECEPNEWILKELETKGEYCASPVNHPDLYAHVAEDGSGELVPLVHREGGLEVLQIEQLKAVTHESYAEIYMMAQY
ncbi:hypothetical protein F5887DRAFT_1192162 [Amanita rubescens]|nr:hypothetical protein F5887DRAFT_1192162 [Amanita rubescens]